MIMIKSATPNNSVGPIDAGYKTFISLRGQRDFSHLNLTILNLAALIFPAYQESLDPVLKALNHHKMICSAFLLPSNVSRLIQIRKLTFGLTFRLYSSIFFSCRLVQEIGLVDFNTLVKVSQRTGSVVVSNPSLFKGMTKFIFANSRTLVVGGSAIGSIAYMGIQYYRAKSDQEKQKLMSTERLFILANQSGRLAVAFVGLVGWQAPLTLACLNVGIALTSYARFLISEKS